MPINYREEYNSSEKKPNIDTILAQPATFKFHSVEVAEPKDFNERSEMIQNFDDKIDTLSESTNSLGSYDKSYSRYLDGLKKIGDQIYGVMDELLKRNGGSQITFSVPNENGYEVKFTIKRSGDANDRLLLEEIKNKIITSVSEKIDGVSKKVEAKKIFLNPKYRGNIDAITVTSFVNQKKDGVEKVLPNSRTEEIPSSEDLNEIFSKYGEKIKSKYNEVLLIKEKKMAA
ncbi:MAG TPA: hypothetical protein P5096_04115 [Patescibacteria group bacterium]|nr:hypothetical protein [Patescibacteria group bacterium]